MSTEYRIISRPDAIRGRKYYVQTRRWWLPIWLDDKTWIIGHRSLAEAEAFAAQLAAGSREEAMLGQWTGPTYRVSQVDYRSDAE